MEKAFEMIKKYLLIFLVVFLPFFFLNLTQEYFTTNKLYLLVIGVVLLLSVSLLQAISNKKIIWKKDSLDLPIFLFIASIAASVVFVSPNKVQALLNLNFGLVMLVSLAILYFFLSRTSYLSSKIYYLASIILSLIAVVYYFQPFKNVNLSQNLIFLKNPAFTPIGNQLDLAIFIGFFVVITAVNFFKDSQTNQAKSKHLILNTLCLILTLVALLMTAVSLFHQSPDSQTANFVLPPFRTSWYAALESLKTPLTAFFGAGIDNFSSVFTKVKDFVYDQSGLWQIGSFNVSRSTVLQIMTEAGLLGIISFGFLIFSTFKLVLKQYNNPTAKPFIFSFFYLFICLVIFPTSLIVWFLFFLNLTELSRSLLIKSGEMTIDFEELPLVFMTIIVLTICLIGGISYFVGRTYLAELYYKKSLNAYISNNALELYNNQKQAIVLNPYMEKYRISFSQDNLLIANSVIVRASQAAQKSGAGGQLNLGGQDKQIVIQSIQAAISEAKAAVSLNPQRATNWENLATIYRNIINLANGADTWTISAYERAIQADPQNPNYRLNLGGVYYFLGRYDDAVNFFTQTIALKPDFANSHFNLAWALFQKGSYTQAAASMQNVLNLIDPKIDKADYDKAAGDLANFKSKFPTSPTTQSNGSGNLNLSVKPPTPKISPKLELHKEASPSAK